MRCQWAIWEWPAHALSRLLVASGAVYSPYWSLSWCGVVIIASMHAGAKGIAVAPNAVATNVVAMTSDYEQYGDILWSSGVTNARSGERFSQWADGCRKCVPKSSVHWFILSYFGCGSD